MRLERPEWLESEEEFLTCVEETYGESPCELNPDYDLEWEEYSGEAHYEGGPCAVLLIDGDVYVRADHKTELRCPRAVAEIATEYFSESIAEPVRQAVLSLGYGTVEDVEVNTGEILAKALSFAEDLEQFRNILYALNEEVNLPRWIKAKLRPEDLTDEEKKVLAEVLQDLNAEEKAPGWLKRWVNDNLDKVDLKLAIAYDVPPDILAQHYTEEDFYKVLPWLALTYTSSYVQDVAKAFKAEPKEAIERKPLKNEALRTFLEEPEWQTLEGRAWEPVFIWITLSSDVGTFRKEDSGYVLLGGKTVAAVHPTEDGFCITPLEGPLGRDPDYSTDRFFHRSDQRRLIATVRGLEINPPVHRAVDATSLARPDLEDLYQNYVREHLSFPPLYQRLKARPYVTADWMPEDLAIVLSLWPSIVVQGDPFVAIPGTRKYAAAPPPTRVAPVPRRDQELLTALEPDFSATEFLVLDEEGRVVPTVLWDRRKQRVKRNPKLADHPKTPPVPIELLPTTIWVSETFYV